MIPKYQDGCTNERIFVTIDFNVRKQQTVVVGLREGKRLAQKHEPMTGMVNRSYHGNKAFAKSKMDRYVNTSG